MHLGLGLDFYSVHTSQHFCFELLSLILIQSHAQYPNGGYPPRYYPWVMPQQYNPYATYNYDPGRFYYDELIRHFNTQKPKETKPIENEELISLVDNVNERLDSYFERTDQLLSLLNEIYNELNSPGAPNQENLNKAELKQFIEEMIRSRSKSIPTNPNPNISSRSGLFSTETRQRPRPNRRNRVNQNMELDINRHSRPHPKSSAASTYAAPSFYPKPATDEIKREKIGLIGPSKSTDTTKKQAPLP